MLRRTLPLRLAPRLLGSRQPLSTLLGLVIGVVLEEQLLQLNLLEPHPVHRPRGRLLGRLQLRVHIPWRVRTRLLFLHLLSE